MPRLARGRQHDGFATPAQAQTGWLENKAFITEDKPFHAVVHPLVGGAKHMTLETTLAGGTTIEILCETLTTSEAKFFGTAAALREAAEGLLKLEFTKCKTLLNKVESAICKPKEPIVASAKFKAILHTTGDKKTYILLEPDVGTKFATLFFANEECVLFPEKAITGSFVEECLNTKLEKNTAGTNFCLEDAEHHLIEEAPTKLFSAEILFGAWPMNLLGIADVLLTGKGTNTWGVHI